MKPDAVAGATEAYFADQDMFGQWLDERCQRGPTLWERPETLFKSWCAYAHEAGDDAGTSKTFKASLEQRGIFAKRANGMRSFRTVALRHPSAGSAT